MPRFAALTYRYGAKIYIEIFNGKLNQLGKTRSCVQSGFDKVFEVALTRIDQARYLVR